VLLSLIYTLHGIGRSTFEGTLRAEFVDMFRDEIEGAFANIVFFSGASSAIGYCLSTGLSCSNTSEYCVKFTDGSDHNMLLFELLVLINGVLAIVGYNRAVYLFREEEQCEILLESETLTGKLVDESGDSLDMVC